MPELRQQMYANYMRSINASVSVSDGVDAQEVSACSPHQDSLSLQLDKPQPAAGQLVHPHLKKRNRRLCQGSVDMRKDLYLEPSYQALVSGLAGPWLYATCLMLFRSCVL